MSGIVGIINLDGAPIDRDLLRRMTDFMSFRGPDAQEMWIDGNVGFGHTMLRTTWEAETETQPLTLDGKVWLTADARIDGRAELIAELEAKLSTKLRVPQGSNGNSSESRIPNDAELILFAYEAWGEDCVKHLIGDFVFAIWDSRERSLFCARDHFGVKPFYYAHLGNVFIFSNTLNCARLHDSVSARLNDRAIGDFLLFGINCEPTSTVFANIARLPGAHTLVVNTYGLQVERYWSLPLEFDLSYKSSRDYPEQFRDLLAQSVKDRLRTNRIALEISGGLDSTSVAAMANKLMAHKPVDSLKAFCVSYDQLIPDQERRYADIAANGLGIPIQHIIGDGFPLFAKNIGGPEPFNIYPLSAITTEWLKQMAAHARVALTGWDGDTWISETPRHYFYFLLKQLKFSQFLSATSSYIKAQHQLPPMGVRSTLKRWTGRSLPPPPYPDWIEPDFEQRMSLRERWQTINADPPRAHPTRPYVFRVLSSPSWTNLFECYDAGQTGLPLESRHPISDVRMVEFFLSLPPIPWCVRKEIIRTAMRGLLPTEILRRPKTPLAGDPVVAMVSEMPARKFDFCIQSDLTEGYVKRDAVPTVAGEKDVWRTWTNLRPFTLDLWLRSYRLAST